VQRNTYETVRKVFSEYLYSIRINVVSLYTWPALRQKISPRIPPMLTFKFLSQLPLKQTAYTLSNERKKAMLRQYPLKAHLRALTHILETCVLLANTSGEIVRKLIESLLCTPTAMIYIMNIVHSTAFTRRIEVDKSKVIRKNFASSLRKPLP